MQSLVDQLHQQRQSHIQNIERLTIKDVKDIVRACYSYPFSYRKKRVTCLGRKRMRSC